MPDNEEGFPEVGSLTLQERKQQLVRSAIWDAATDLFAEQGYDETTIDDIAKRAGISRRSFFRYFSSKSALMAYGVVDYAKHLTDAIEACPPNTRFQRFSGRRYFKWRSSAPHNRARERLCKSPRSIRLPEKRTSRALPSCMSVLRRRSRGAAQSMQRKTWRPDWLPASPFPSSR